MSILRVALIKNMYKIDKVSRMLTLISLKKWNLHFQFEKSLNNSIVSSWKHHSWRILLRTMDRLLIETAQGANAV